MLLCLTPSSDTELACHVPYGELKITFCKLLHLCSEGESSFIVHLSRGQRAGAQAIAHAFRSEISSVTAAAVDFPIRSVIEVGRIQGTFAVPAAEAATYLVKKPKTRGTFSDVELGKKLPEAMVVEVKDSWHVSHTARDVRLSTSRHKSRSVSVAKAFGPKLLGVAGLAVDFAIWSVTSKYRVQWPVAFITIETLLVPHLLLFVTPSCATKTSGKHIKITFTTDIFHLLPNEDKGCVCVYVAVCHGTHRALCQLLFRCKHCTATPWATLTFWCLDGGCVWIVVWPEIRNLLLPVIYYQMSKANSREAVCLQESGATSEAVPVWAELLAVASLAVDITVWSITCYYGVEGLVAVTALETLAMPFLKNAQHIALRCKLINFVAASTRSLCGLLVIEHVASTSPVLTSQVHNIPIDSFSVALKCSATLAVTIALWAKLLAIAYCTLYIFVRSVAVRGRVEGVVAHFTLEAVLVPCLVKHRTTITLASHISFTKALSVNGHPNINFKETYPSTCQHLLCSVHIATTARAALPFRSLGDCSRLQRGMVHYHVPLKRHQQLDPERVNKGVKQWEKDRPEQPLQHNTPDITATNQKMGKVSERSWVGETFDCWLRSTICQHLDGWLVGDLGSVGCFAAQEHLVSVLETTNKRGKPSSACKTTNLTTNEHCASVQSLALSSDGALDVCGTVTLIAPALLGRKRGKYLQSIVPVPSGDLNQCNADLGAWLVPTRQGLVAVEERGARVTGRGRTQAEYISKCVTCPAPLCCRIIVYNSKISDGTMMLRMSGRYAPRHQGCRDVTHHDVEDSVTQIQETIPVKTSCVCYSPLLQMFTLVHAEAACTTAEAVALRAELAGVADLAEQFSFVLSAPMRVIEVNVKRCWNEGVGETVTPRENPPINGIVWHNSHLQKSDQTLLTTLEAHLVPLQTTCNSLFCRIYGLAAFRALRILNWLERHLDDLLDLHTNHIPWNQWCVVKCCKLRWYMPGAVHTRRMEQEPVTRVEQKETECNAATHERAFPNDVMQWRRGGGGAAAPSAPPLCTHVPCERAASFQNAKYNSLHSTQATSGAAGGHQVRCWPRMRGNAAWPAASASRRRDARPDQIWRTASVRREHCMSIQSLARSGDGALDARVIVAHIDGEKSSWSQHFELRRVAAERRFTYSSTVFIASELKCFKNAELLLPNHVPLFIKNEINNRRGKSKHLLPCTPQWRRKRISTNQTLDSYWPHGFADEEELGDVSENALVSADFSLYDRIPTILPHFCTITRAAVAERLDCSPPTTANWVQSPAEPLLDFHKWES
ncbi:hypothetical protein PR048_019348 [Dryococelus australis]|uniref:Uncharacterized protein n=1 Tax=Dryococelus australis TaxID=614101 RepID=A0ABQ9H3A3_9NEOP|nr:hypothetical protein PR048_019348 [Dryococelus australis]